MHDDHGRMIDDEIDAVARSLAASSPSPALRSAVRSRIAGTAGLGYVWRWSVGAVGAAVVIGIALVWPDRESTKDVPASREAVANVSPAATGPAIEQPAAAPASVVGRSLSGSPGEPDAPSPDGVGAARPTNEVVASETRRPAENVTQELFVESLEVVQLDVHELQVPTLAVEAMTIPPLSIQ